MKKILTNPYLNLVARLVVAWVFIYAAIGKIADPQTFAKEISNYGLVPFFAINIIALILPWIELLAGVLLASGVRIKANALISGVLLLVFVIGVLSAMIRGLNINCGCFSHRIVYVGWPKVLENTGLIILCIYIFFKPLQNFSLERYIINDEK